MTEVYFIFVFIFIFNLVVTIGNVMVPTVAIGAALGGVGLALGAKGVALTLLGKMGLVTSYNWK